MKKIFIYGDSNVWGDNFYLGERIPMEKQWPNILKRLVGDDYIIYQEGLPGRLAGNDEKVKTYKNGKDTFLATFRTKAPVDYIFISLGTNDLQIKYGKNSNQIIKDLLWYKETILEQFEDLEDRKKYFQNQLPKIIYILPCNFAAPEVFNEKSHNSRKEIITYFKDHFDSHEFIELDNIPLFEDGIHLNYEGHEIVAQKVSEVLDNE